MTRALFVSAGDNSLVERLLEFEGLEIGVCPEMHDGLLTLSSVSGGCESGIISSRNLFADVKLLSKCVRG